MNIDKELDCEECGAKEESDNYVEGVGWVCDHCKDVLEDDDE